MTYDYETAIQLLYYYDKIYSENYLKFDEDSTARWNDARAQIKALKNYLKNF